MTPKKSIARVAGIAMLTSLVSFPLYAQQNDEVFGRELMTQQELREHRQTMQNLNSDAERQQYLERHRELMLERSRERGVELRQGNGPGMRNGQGMGNGQGMQNGQGMGNMQGQGNRSSKGSGSKGNNQPYKQKGSGGQGG